MEINITPTTRQIWQQTLDQLSGQARRLFMASVVMGMGRGGAAWAKRELMGRDRTTVRKGMHELETGVVCFDNVGLRGRKGFAAKLPQLQDDLRAIGEASPNRSDFPHHPALPPPTAAEAKRQLLEKGYSEKDIPS